jgi:hypothetical protein
LGRLDLDTWRSSTKIEALIEELTNLRLKDATTKSIVFSQFVNFLDLIAYRLQKAGFTVSNCLALAYCFHSPDLDLSAGRHYVPSGSGRYYQTFQCVQLL